MTGKVQQARAGAAAKHAPKRVAGKGGARAFVDPDAGGNARQKVAENARTRPGPPVLEPVQRQPHRRFGLGAEFQLSNRADQADRIDTSIFGCLPNAVIEIEQLAEIVSQEQVEFGKPIKLPVLPKHRAQ